MDATPDTLTEPRPLDQLATALAAFQTEMPTVTKAHTAQVKSDKGSYSYTYAGLADVSEAAMPLLSKHGLSFSTLPGPGVLTGMLLHKSGQYLTASLPITGGTPQAVGSSLTYMRRYLLGCMTGIVTDDDDDGQTAQATERKRRAPQAEPVEAQPTRTMSRARPPAPAEPAEVEPDGITPAQLKKMAAGMRDAGITERGHALAYVAQAIGREVESRNDLTKAEASRVIEALETPDGPSDADWDAMGARS